jgi:hypothetical protein
MKLNRSEHVRLGLVGSGFRGRFRPRFFRGRRPRQAIDLRLHGFLTGLKLSDPLE